jgi:flagellar biosynthesis protein FliR
VTIRVADDVVLAFALLFVRAAAVLMLLPPALGVRVPVTVRLLLAVVLAGALVPVAKLQMPAPAAGALAAAVLVLREIAIGLALSFAAALVVGVAAAAGDMLGSAMELFSGGILRGAQLFPNPVADALGTMSGLLFFIAGLHRALLLALAQSVVVAPLGRLSWPGADQVLAAGAQIFAIALEIALPVLIPLLLLIMAQGVLARLAPQVNMLMVAPVAMALAGIALLVLDSYGLCSAILQAWGRILHIALGWLNG